jgi:hypothetical protein
VLQSIYNCLGIGWILWHGLSTKAQHKDRSFEGVAKFKHLGTALTDENCMQEEIKRRLN